MGSSLRASNESESMNDVFYMISRIPAQRLNDYVVKANILGDMNPHINHDSNIMYIFINIFIFHNFLVLYGK